MYREGCFVQVVQKLNQAAVGSSSSGGASSAPIEVLDLFASVESYCGQFTEKELFSLQ